MGQRLGLGLLLIAAMSFASAAAEKNCQDDLNCKSARLAASEEERKVIFEFAEDYKAFMRVARTERFFVSEAIFLAEAAGFSRLKTHSPMEPGAKYYDVNRDRAIAIMIIGDEEISSGMRVVGAHIDSPRPELEGQPLFSADEFALCGEFINRHL